MTVSIGRLYSIVFLLFSIACINTEASGQDVELTEIRTAIKTGSSKELSKYFNDVIDLNINGERKDFKKTNAEFALKDFFNRNTAVDFTYVHHGSSKDGLKYAIGKYVCHNASYRVYMLLKVHQGKYIINSLDFSKE